MDERLITTTLHELQAANHILIASHLRPDGDAVGSLLGLGLALQDAGKTVQMVLADGVPTSENHLQGSTQVRSKPEGQFDLSVVVDCSELSRVGDAWNSYGVPDWNIDHHITNLNFARVNLVESEAASTSEILAELIPAWGLPLSQGVISALLTGIITDTIGFRTSNVSPKTLRITADLVEAGGNLFDLYQRSLLQRSYQAARYWGFGLSKIQREGRMAWTTLTVSDRRAAAYSGCDDADMINFVSAINDIDVSLIFVEQNSTHIKVSWRSNPGYDVSNIALGFGGGGHMAAAGADIEGTLEEVQKKVLEATRSILGVA